MRPGRIAALSAVVVLAACAAAPSAVPGTPSTTGRAPSPSATSPVVVTPRAEGSTTLSAPAQATSTAVRERPPPGFAFPVADAASAGFADTHHDYPAADIFHPSGCGAVLVSPVDGVVLELRRDDGWSAAVDDPATRGGIYLSILGDDGVRYYLAHLQTLDPLLSVGTRLTAGTPVGSMGRTGRAGACHLHFALSPPCPSPEWWVRRGVVWPQPFLRDWQGGGQATPRDVIAEWQVSHPDACTSAGTAT